MKDTPSLLLSGTIYWHIIYKNRFGITCVMILAFADLTRAMCVMTFIKRGGIQTQLLEGSG